MLRRVALLLVTAVLTACQILNTDEDKKQAGRILNGRREASLSAWQGKKIDGSDPGTYAGERTAFLLPAQAIVPSSIHRGVRKEGTATVKFRIRGDWSIGCAVPVSEDGYFLTAAHCVEDSPEFIVLALGRKATVEHARVRVIWKSDPKRAGLDLALIHAPVRLWETFQLSQKPAGPHTELLACGAGAAVPTNFTPTLSGGRILRVYVSEAEDGQPKCWELKHNAPLAPGDSGGPVMDAEGNLVGISSGITGRWGFGQTKSAILFYRGWAGMVDPAWLQAMMDRDRKSARHSPGKPGSGF